MRTKNLPETESLQDDEKILCSPDDEHLYKIKKRFITGAGASKGGLMYWTETKDKIYSQIPGVPFNQQAIIYEKFDYVDKDGWHHWYFEVFGKKITYVAEEPNARDRALREARGYGIVSTDGFEGHIPQNYAIYPKVTSFNMQFTREQILSHDPIAWEDTSDIAMISLQDLYNEHLYERGFERTSFMGYITLRTENHVGDLWHGFNMPGYWYSGFSNWKSDVGDAGSGGYRGGRISDPEVNLFNAVDAKYIFFLTCTGETVYASSSDYTDYTTREMNSMDITLSYSTYSYDNIRGVYQNHHETLGKWSWNGPDRIDAEILDRSPMNTCYFTDDNRVKWVLTIIPAKWTGKYIYTPRGWDFKYLDPTFPEIDRNFTELSEINIGPVRNHWSYYDGADPVDVQHPTLPMLMLSNKSWNTYAKNLGNIGRDIIKALGVTTYKGVIPDDVPEHIKYITRTSIQITSDGTCFSAGELDGEDNYTENFRVDAVKGDIYEKGQKLSEKYAQMTDLPKPMLPFSDTPVQIGTWIDGRPVWRVVYYRHNTEYQSVTSHLLCTLPLTKGYSSSDAVLTYVSLATNIMSGKSSPQWTPLPMDGNSYRKLSTSMGPRYFIRFLNNVNGCRVFAEIDIPDYGWDMDYWPYLDICIVAEFVV